MKRKEMIIINAALVLLVAGFAVITINLSANQGLWTAFVQAIDGHTVQPAQTLADSDARCSNNAPLQLPASAASDPQLSKLTAYQDACNSFVTKRLMFFIGFPATPADADAMSKTIAAKLILYQQAGVTPLVIAEPYVGNGLMEYRDFMNGKYDQALDRLFAQLKAAGVTDQMMGTWVPFPESNTPNWANKDTEPSDFAICVNKYLKKLKQYFPGAGGSILLNSETYEPTDTEWNNGDYLDLTPYVQDLDKTLVTSVGIQGFPWVSKATTAKREIFHADEFLQPDLAIAAARELRTRDIWFNTGTFASKYTNDPPNRVDISPDDRSAILNDILNVVQTVETYQQNQYRVSVNLFSEDKHDTSEAVDWSYFQNADQTTVLKEFLHKASTANLDISLFDQEHK